MSSIDELYSYYIEKRVVNLNREQFTLFAEFFPAVLVLLSDGILDTKEKVYLEKLVHNLSLTFSEDGFGVKKVHELELIFKQEFDYLIGNIEFWKDKYLKALRNHLEKYPESKSTILDAIRLFAETSQDVNEAENNMIRFLTRELNLHDTATLQ